MNSHASSFFHKHKELFEFAKYVGPETSVSNGTKSFLDQYRECEAQQATELAISPQIGFMFSTIAVNPTSPPAFSLSTSFAIAPREGTSPSKVQMRVSKAPYSFPTPPPPSVHWQQESASPRNSYLEDLTMANSVGQGGNSRQAQQPPHAHQSSSAALSRLPPPVRHQQPNERYDFPKLSTMLIDHATRADVAQQTRLDVTQKIELLTGSKCLGRINSESSNLPPSIRSRLQASSNIQHRREKLYTLLSRDYAELADLHTR